MGTENELHWLGRPIAKPEDAHGLETKAAIHEFNHKLPRHQAEQKAYDEYVHENHVGAAAHHLSGMKAAQASGHMEEARKHGVLYEMHINALGHAAHQPVPLEVQAKAAEGGEPVYKFKPHSGDVHVLTKFEEMAKSQRCQWMSTESTKQRCGNPASIKVGGRSYCYIHARKLTDRKPGAAAGHKSDIPGLAKSTQERLHGLYKSLADIVMSEKMKKSAPPGFSEETMHKLKDKHGTESAFKIAWAAYEKHKAKNPE
jgi:hypothetical protein